MTTLKIFSKSIRCDHDKFGVAGSFFQIYIREFLGIESEDSFNLLLNCYPNLRVNYPHSTTKDIERSVSKCKSAINSHVFPGLTRDTIYKK